MWLCYYILIFHFTYYLLTFYYAYPLISSCLILTKWFYHNFWLNWYSVFLLLWLWKRLLLIKEYYIMFHFICDFCFLELIIASLFFICLVFYIPIFNFFHTSNSLLVQFLHGQMYHIIYIFPLRLYFWNPLPFFIQSQLVDLF